MNSECAFWIKKASLKNKRKSIFSVLHMHQLRFFYTPFAKHPYREAILRHPASFTVRFNSAQQIKRIPNVNTVIPIYFNFDKKELQGIAMRIKNNQQQGKSCNAQYYCNTHCACTLVVFISVPSLSRDFCIFTTQAKVTNQTPTSYHYRF